MIYRFEKFELDTDRFELRLNGSPRKVEPQVFALLELIVSNHTRMVTKDEINLHVWGGRMVSEAVVNSRVRMVRQAIGDDGKAQKLIRTVHGRGFRFVGEVAAETTINAAQPGGTEHEVSQNNSRGRQPADCLNRRASVNCGAAATGSDARRAIWQFGRCGLAGSHN